MAFSQLYAWYGEHGEELYPIYRDAPSMPRTTQDAMRAESEARTDALLDDITLPAGTRRSVRAVAGHLLGLWTWRSLWCSRASPEWKPWTWPSACSARPLRQTAWIALLILGHAELCLEIGRFGTVVDAAYSAN